MELRCENISKHFGAVVALNDVSISVDEGEVRALLGGNGSGKSTLAKILGGIYFANSGEITFGDSNITKSSPRKSKNKGIIITSQELSIFTNLTVSENLNIADVPTKRGTFIDKAKMKTRSIEVLKKLHIEDMVDRPVASLPPNKLYLLEFAKALLQAPKILVIDEITSALFRDDVEIVKDIIKNDLKPRGTVVLFISHRMNEIYTICDSVTVMRNGESVGTFRIDEKDENELLALMVGRTLDDIKRVQTAKHPIKSDDIPIALKLNDFRLKKFDTRINLSIKQGEIIGIAGLQGHGQSELVRALFGLAGEVDFTLNGSGKTIHSPSDAVKTGLAFISGDRVKEGVFPIRSVAENLRAVTDISLRKTGMDSDKGILEELGVKYDNTSQSITELSGGNQQKVIVGRWTSSDPVILLADDPTKGIDVQARRDIHDIFREMAAGGASILMFSSDDEELVELTSLSPRARVIVMYEGSIAAELKGEDISTHNIIDKSLAKIGEEREAC